MNTSAPQPALRRRTSDLVTTRVESEVIAFDQQANVLHHLDATTAAVWYALDLGEDASTIVDTLARQGIQASADSVAHALRLLDDAGLLLGSLPSSTPRPPRSRRELLRKAGLASAVALPTLLSVTPAGATQVSLECSYPLAPTEALCLPIAQALAQEEETEYTPAGCATCTYFCTLIGNGCYLPEVNCDVTTCDR